MPNKLLMHSGPSAPHWTRSRAPLSKTLVGSKFTEY